MNTNADYLNEKLTAAIDQMAATAGLDRASVVRILAADPEYWAEFMMREARSQLSANECRAHHRLVRTGMDPLRARDRILELRGAGPNQMLSAAEQQSRNLLVGAGWAVDRATQRVVALRERKPS